jgi:hypothetical protein
MTMNAKKTASSLMSIDVLVGRFFHTTRVSDRPASSPESSSSHRRSAKRRTAVARAGATKDAGGRNGQVRRTVAGTALAR